MANPKSFMRFYQIIWKLLRHVFALKISKELVLQNLIDFFIYTQSKLNTWTTISDCPSKIKVANESLTVAMVEAVECLLSKL